MSEMSKAQIIRETIAMYPDKGPSEIAKLLGEKFPALSFKANEISTIKSEMKKAKQTGKVGRPPKAAQTVSQPAVMAIAKASSTDDMASKLEKLREAANAVGGPEEAKRILDLLK